MFILMSKLSDWCIGVREIEVLAKGFTETVDRDRAAAAKLLDYIGKGTDTVLGSSWPTWQSLTAMTPQVKLMIEDNRVEFKRIAQLAVPAVAAATGPRFCAGGADAEKEAVGDTCLRLIEQRGFPIIEPIRRIWAGGRNLDEVCAGCDPQTRHLVKSILDQVVEHPDELPESHERKERIHRCLRNEERVFKVVAKLAVAADSEQTSFDRDRCSAIIMEDLGTQFRIGTVPHAYVCIHVSI
eukprot:SAG31_NODE_2225_length_6150_cov_2.229549_2_plen_240_part_00